MVAKEEEKDWGTERQERKSSVENGVVK